MVAKWIVIKDERNYSDEINEQSHIDILKYITQLIIVENCFVPALLFCNMIPVCSYAMYDYNF